jgi:hypothetical protein
MPTKIYRFPKSIQFFLFLGMCFFIAISFLTLQDKKSIGIAVILIPIAIAVTVYFWWSIFRVEVSDHEISTFRIGQKRSIRWDEIGDVRSKALENDLLLTSRDGEKKLKISSQIVGYDEVVDQLRKKCPDLWKNEPLRIFHQSIGSPVFMALFALLFAVVGTKGIIEKDSIFSSLVLLAFALVVIAILSRIIWLAEIQNDELCLRTVWGEQKIKVSEIKNIRLAGQDMGYSTVTHFVIIELVNNKSVRLGNFREGIPMLYNSLKSWFEEYLQH